MLCVRILPYLGRLEIYKYSKKSIHLLTCHFFVAKWRIFLIRVYFARELYSTLQGQFKYTFLRMDMIDFKNRMKLNEK